MKNRTQDPLERLIDRQLLTLPDLAAPPSLVPAVFAALEARARLPWWKRAWPAWPLSLRALSLALLLILGGGLTYLVFALGVSGSLGSILARLAQSVRFLSPLWSLASSLVDALALGFRSCGPSLLWGSVVLIGGTYLTCVALGTLCYRVAMNKF